MRIIKYLLPFLLCVVVFLFLAARDLSDENMTFSDESRHLMDGVFISDIIHDIPSSLSHPISYAVKYYIRYPALSIFFYYPPLFAIVEGVFFTLFKVSTFYAHVCVLVFGLIAIIFWFLLVRGKTNTLNTLLLMLLVFTNGTIVYWAKKIMLEMPTLSFILIDMYFIDRYLNNRKGLDLFLGICFAILSVLVKQSAGFVFIVITAVFCLSNKSFFRSRKVILFVCMVVAILLFSAVTFKYSKFYISAVILSGDILSKIKTNLVSLPMLFYHGMNKAVIFFAVIGIVFVVLRKDQLKKYAIFFAWTMSFYLFNLILLGDNMRYTYFCIPPVYCFAVVGVENSVKRAKKYGPVFLSAIIVPIIAAQFINSVRQEREYIRGYDQAAKYIVDNYDGKCVLFDGWYDGNFIFYVRYHDSERKLVVMRGSKMLVSFASFKKYFYEERIKTKKEIFRMLKGFHVRFIVVEERDVFDSVPLRLLRNILKTQASFDLVYSININTTVEQLKGTRILVYKYKGRFGPLFSTIKLPLSGIGKEFSGEVESL